MTSLPERDLTGTKEAVRTASGDAAFTSGQFIRSRSRTAEQIRARDWSRTPLGPMAEWDPALQGALNLILDTGFPMFIAWGDDFRMFYNDAYEPALLGKIGCLGESMPQVFPEAWSGVGPLVRRALAGETCYHEDFEVPLVRNAVLSSTWWSFSYSPIRGADGIVGGVLGVVYETTRRLLSDAALRSSEAALLTVTDMAPSLLWRCEANGQLTWVNQRLMDYFGLEQLGSARWDDFVLPEDVKTAHAVHDLSVREGRPFQCQQRLLGTDGLHRWFMVRCQQVHDADGVIAGWCGSAIDIDDWRRAADGLTEREDLLRDFYGAEATLLWVAELETRRVTAVSSRSPSLWGLPENGEGIGWDSWADWVHPDDRALFLAAFDRAASGKAAQAKFRRIAARGCPQRFQLTAFPIATAAGEPRRLGGMVVEVGRDVEARAYLTDCDASRQAALSQAFSKRGFRVRIFDTLAELAGVADDLLPGCVIIGVDHDLDQVLKAGATLKLAPHLRWIAVGDFSSRMNDVVRLMKVGAEDVLSNPEPDAIADAGQAALALARPPEARPAGVDDARQKIDQLSPREREVLMGLVAGGTNKAIAQQLNLSPRTVETHRSHVMNRLGVTTLAELVRLAASAGI